MDIIINNLHLILDASGIKKLKIQYEVTDDVIRVQGYILHPVDTSEDWTVAQLEPIIEAHLRTHAELIAGLKVLIAKYKGQTISLNVEDLFEVTAEPDE